MAAVNIECPICFEPYDANLHVPLMFPECGHSACAVCMRDLGKNGTEPTIQCPTDRKTQSLPRGLDGLSKNFGLLEALNTPLSLAAAALPAPKNDPLCEFCDEEPHPALYRCLECQQVECMHTLSVFPNAFSALFVYTCVF